VNGAVPTDPVAHTFTDWQALDHLARFCFEEGRSGADVAEELGRVLAATGRTPEHPARGREECTCDEINCCPSCRQDAEDLIGFTVRDRDNGRTFIVEEIGDKDGWPTLDGGLSWARSHDVTVLAPPRDQYDPTVVYCPECKGPAENGSRNRISATHVEYRCAAGRGFFSLREPAEEA